MLIVLTIHISLVSEKLKTLNAKARFNEDSPLLESGLMGKAHLLLYQTSGNE